MTFVPFSKYSGCGNDFILIDNRSAIFPNARTGLMRHLCDRREGIGADGVILLENSSRCDVRMRIYNSDGSEAEMCGNGIRCLMRFVNKLIPTTTRCVVETIAGMIPLEIIDDQVRASIGSPTNLQWGLKVDVNATPLTVHSLNTGVPHCVAFVPDVHPIDLKTLGPQLRHHPIFHPKGSNVNIAAVADDHITYRTYERGVEDETPACGTGAVAVALAVAKTLNWASPISVKTHSGTFLTIGFSRHQDTFFDITMTGPATHTFDGSISLYFERETQYDSI